MQWTEILIMLIAGFWTHMVCGPKKESGFMQSPKGMEWCLPYMHGGVWSEEATRTEAELYFPYIVFGHNFSFMLGIATWVHFDKMTKSTKIWLLNSSIWEISQQSMNNMWEYQTKYINNCSLGSEFMSNCTCFSRCHLGIQACHKHHGTLQGSSYTTMPMH